MVLDRVSTSSSSGSFASFDPDTSAWRTSGGSRSGGSIASSERWPKWGTTRSGSAFAARTSERLIDASERSSWPTPTRSDAKLSRRHGYMTEGNPGTTLTDAVVSHHGGETRGGGRKHAAPFVPNPDFVEWLMGFPEGWTRSDDSELSETR